MHMLSNIVTTSLTGVLPDHALQADGHAHRRRPRPRYRAAVLPRLLRSGLPRARHQVSIVSLWSHTVRSSPNA